MDLPERKNPRLRGFDYNTPGGYFITICVKDRKPILGQIVGGGVLDAPEIKLTRCGEIVRDIIDYLSQRFNVEIDKYVIMPDHIHMLIVVKENMRAIHESPLQGAYNSQTVGAHHDAPEKNTRSIISKTIGFLKTPSHT